MKTKYGDGEGKGIVEVAVPRRSPDLQYERNRMTDYSPTARHNESGADNNLNESMRRGGVVLLGRSESSFSTCSLEITNGHLFPIPHGKRKHHELGGDFKSNRGSMEISFEDFSLVMLSKFYNNFL